jgi:hypothetical protein
VGRGWADIYRPKGENDGGRAPLVLRQKKMERGWDRTEEEEAMEWKEEGPKGWWGR